MFTKTTILFLTFFLASNIASVEKYFKNLESSESINSFYVINVDESVNTNEILKYLSLPIINIKNGTKINYLNLPRFKLANSIKYYFNYNFATIIIATNFNDNFIYNELFWETLKFSRSNILIFVVDKIHRNTWNPLAILSKFNFLNVMFLDMDKFRNSNTFYTFRRFPKYSMIKTSKFTREYVENTKLSRIKLACEYLSLLSKCVKKNKKIIGFGLIFHVVNNFIKFINGTVELSMYLDINEADLWTRSELLTINEIRERAPLDREIFSNSLEQVSLIIVISKPDFIQTYLYIIKPFSLLLWISCFGYLIFGSAVKFQTFKITKKNLSLWQIFDQLIRTLLAQSYSSTLTGFINSAIYLLEMLFGYIITVWYSALLGTFLTTYIREPYISTVNELKKSKFKIMVDSNIFNTTSGYDKIKDIMIDGDLKRYGAFVVSSMQWDLFGQLDNYYILKDFYLESSYLRHIFSFNSIYKSKFNRYIGILKDSGLYNFWKRNSLIAMPDHDKAEYIAELKSNFNYDDNLRVLNINYFLYPYFVWFIGSVIGIFVFISEMLHTTLRIKIAEMVQFLHKK